MSALDILLDTGRLVLILGFLVGVVHLITVIIDAEERTE